MIRRPPRSPFFPSPPLFRSPPVLGMLGWHAKVYRFARHAGVHLADHDRLREHHLRFRKLVNVDLAVARLTEAAEGADVARERRSGCHGCGHREHKLLHVKALLPSNIRVQRLSAPSMRRCALPHTKKDSEGPAGVPVRKARDYASLTPNARGKSRPRGG